MAWAGPQAGGPGGGMWRPEQPGGGAGVVPAAVPIVAPNTDSLLSRFGLKSGDEIMGRFLVGDADSDYSWFRGVSGGSSTRAAVGGGGGG
jgi:hypothetical protein